MLAGPDSFFVDRKAHHIKQVQHTPDSVRVFCIDSAAVAFPKKNPQEALGSVLKAVDAKRFDYVAAQLADPVFIDDRVRRLYGGRFEEQVLDTRNGLTPEAAALLRRFLKDGAWQAEKETAERGARGR